MYLEQGHPQTRWRYSEFAHAVGFTVYTSEHKTTNKKNSDIRRIPGSQPVNQRKQRIYF